MSNYKVFIRTRKQKYIGEQMPDLYVFTTGSWSDIPESGSYDMNDKSTPTFWMTTGYKYYDYMFAREQSSLYIQNHEDYSKISTEDKQYASQTFIIPVDSRSVHYSAEEQRKHWNSFAKRMIECRYQRWEDGRAYASYALGIDASTQMGIDTNDIAKEWKDYNTTKLFEWFEGTGSYSGSGYPATNYYTASIGNNVLEILRDGIKH
jgi:hypothetical protein